MKKALMNASVASMIYRFNMNNIETLESLGYSVDVACNFGKENPISKNEIDTFKSILNKKNINVFETNCPRNILKIKKMFKTYIELKKLANNDYDIVHTQSPIGGVLCRLAFRNARKKGTKIVYTAHGFHFYKGGPILSWILFYPLELLCSRYTDVLITINQEDYLLAKTKMKAKKIKYIHGVGVNIQNAKNTKVDVTKIRNRIGINDKIIWVLTVGELSQRKNQKKLIEAVSLIDNIYLTIVGKGPLKDDLQQYINDNDLGNKVKLLGFRTDVIDLCASCDLFAFPSFQEGLPVALMEAMSAKKPVICSNIRGNVDLIRNKEFLFDPNSNYEIKKAIENITKENWKEIGLENYNFVSKFDIKNVNMEMKSIYSFDYEVN